MGRISAALALSLALASSAGAKTAAELKTALEGIAPSNTIVRLAYIKYTGWSEFAMNANSGTKVYVVSSENGVVRQLTADQGRFYNVNITADGKRVFYYDNASGNTYIVNWDGSGRKVAFGGKGTREYWRNPADGSDWAIYENGQMWRVKIDAPTQTVHMSTYPDAGDGTGMTDDGSHVLVKGNDKFGLAPVGGGSVGWGIGGCQASVRAGGAKQWSCNSSGHGEAVVQNTNGTVAFRIPMAATAKSSTGEGGRWTQHANYFTYMASTNGGALAGNPILHRVTDNKIITIEDNVAGNTFCGDMDAVFLPAGSVSVEKAVAAIGTLRQVTAERLDSYSIDGRRIATSAGSTGHRGIVIKRVQGETVAHSRLVTPH